MSDAAEIERWLEAFSSKLFRAKQMKLVMPNRVPPNSCLSLFPEVAYDKDPELDPLKVVEFLEARKGLLPLCEYVAFDRPFAKFSINELRSAFLFQDNESHRPSSRSDVSSLQVNSEPNSKKRVRSDSDTATAKYPRISGSFDARSQMHLIESTMTSPPLPPGPPPSSNGTIPQAINGDIVDEAEQEEIKPIVWKYSEQEELLKTINALINISDWPKSCRSLVTAFREAGYPEGNVFAVIPVKEDAPHSYFRRIKSPIDLMTIYMRVSKGNFYRSFYHFEGDIRRVAHIALSCFEGSKSLLPLATHFAKKVDVELGKCYEMFCKE